MVKLNFCANSTFLVMDLGFSKAKLQVNMSYSMEFFNDNKNAWEPFMDRVEKVQLEFDLNRREFGLIVGGF